ncbi:PREDICTED: spermatogenesis-associated protein 31A1 [Ceratotherium simum simum]|uniref:Spermatogenesis-associated protein 31A1 n=1 Tax=Ceratotherium simum simum TaxID=73337 RepID=A0ABM1CCU8_CERSS|nr:PREDICTED: spermatogenesis-associated protein 31A1 [Ceratotherium simum simum]
MEDAAPTAYLSASSALLTKRPPPLACTLSADPQEDRPDLQRIPLGTVAGSLPLGNSGLASPISGLVRTSCPISFLCQWWKITKALFFTSSQHESHHEHLSHHPPEASFSGAPPDRQVEAGSPSFVNAEVQKMLNIQITQRVELMIGKKKEKDVSFLKQLSSDYHLNSSGNTWKSLGAERDTTTSQSLWTLKDKPEQLPGSQQLSYPKALGDHLQQKCSQLYWGLPSLHSESLVATALVSRSSSQLQAPSVLFNGISNRFPVPIWPEIPSRLSQAPPLPYPGAQPQPLTPNLPQFQPPPLPQTQTQAHLASSPPTRTPSSPLQMRTCGVSCPTHQNKTQSFIPTKIHLELFSLQKQLKRERALPSVVKRSEEVFSQLIPNLPQDSGASHAHKSVSTLHGDLISPNLQKQHLQKRLIKDEHQDVLPHRIQVSLELMQPQNEFPGAYQAQGKQEPSQPSAFVDESSQDTQKMWSRCPRKSHGRSELKFQVGKAVSRGLGKCLKGIPDLSRGSASFPAKVPGMNSEESERYLMRPSKTDSGNCLPRDPDKKHLEKILKVHLGMKSVQIKEGLIPVSVRQSWLAANYVCPKSHIHMETGNPASLKGPERCVNTSCEHSVLSPHTRQVLEAHIIKLQVKHQWGLPLKVLKSIKVFKLKKVQPSPLPRSAFPPSTACVSGAHSKANFTKVLGKPLQPRQREKLITKESIPTLASPLPAPSPVCEEIQKALGGTPPGDGPSEAPLTGQEGRPPSQSLTCSLVGRNWHSEIVMGAEKGSPEPSPSSATARNEPRLESGDQASRDPCRSSSPQKECTSGDTPASQVPYDFTSSARRSRGQQEPRTPKVKDPHESQSKIFAQTDKRADCRRPKPGETEESYDCAVLTI